MDNVENNRIDITQLTEMFDNIKANTDWPIQGDMLWGYFFTHHEPTKLEIAKNILINLGYSFVDLYLSDQDELNQTDLFWLHVEKVETHTPQSLNQLNRSFYLLADQLGLDTYDGMDVEPAP